MINDQDPASVFFRTLDPTLTSSIVLETTPQLPEMQFTYRLAIITTFVLCFLLLYFFLPASKEEDMESILLKRMAILKEDLQHYESLLSSVKYDLALFREFHEKCALGASDGHPVLPKESVSAMLSTRKLRPYSIYNSLPHLINFEEALTPALSLGKDREDVSLIIGIPTVKRPTQSYLLPTIRNLLDSMLPEEKNDTLIIVFIAEADVSFVESTVNSIIRQFDEDVESGLIEIVAPSSSYYPNLRTIKRTLGDSDQRTRWRTKQNLDYAYLMMYASGRGKYYVQLEDDVQSKKGFVSTMKNFAISSSMKGEDWFMLDFCQLGFIGKLFRSSDLWKIVQFILLFYKDKPGDWLLSHFFNVKYCKLDYNHKRCLKELEKRWIHYKPSLFQHIGMISSLNGKVQRLKDRQFGKLELFIRHSNPEAYVNTSIKHYGKFSLEKAYKGMNFFWGLAPQEGDKISFTFGRKLCLKRYRFVSGNAEHPSDKIRNATLEVKSSASLGILNSKDYSLTSDNYIVIDKFDDMGILDGTFDSQLCPITAVRVTLKHSSDFWVILSEILLEEDKN